jgi:pyocin large subunit-like protein
MEFGAGGTYATADDYEAAAIAFLNAPKTKNIVDCTRRSGDYIRYDKGANIMAVCRKDGALRTFFKPNKIKHRQKSNLAYFRQSCLQ